MLDSDLMVLLAAASGVVAMLVVMGFNMASAKKMQAKFSSLESEIDSLKKELKTVNRGTLGVGQHLSALEKRLLSGLNKVEKQSLKEMSMLSFGDANRLVEQGVDADLLVKRCGMSRAEAELMCKLRQTA